MILGAFVDEMVVENPKTELELKKTLQSLDVKTSERTGYSTTILRFQPFIWCFFHWHYLKFKKLSF